MKPFEVEVLEKSIEQKGNMLKSCYDDDIFKSWSGDLQKRFPSGSWKTVNGAKVFVNNGKVVAGLDGFNGEIDKFFEEKEKKEGKPKAKVGQIFDYVQGLNPKTTTVSSMGSMVTSMNQQVADSVFSEVFDAVKEGTLARKILESNRGGRFSDKQLWTISYELSKNDKFSEKVYSFYLETIKKQSRKIKESKRKRLENKLASSVVLSSIKEAGLKLGDYYSWLNTSGNPYRKEHFSKKYTQESANKFMESANKKVT